MMKVRFMLLLTLYLIIQNTIAVAAPVVTGNKVDSASKIKVIMRDNGYTLGDIIAMHVEFNLTKGLVFDPNSVPLNGPVNNWLDLREVKMVEVKNADESSNINIDFSWQVFGTVEHAQTIKIPAIQLQTIPADNDANARNTANNKPLAITIPAQGFRLSPVLPPTITENTHRPYAPPLRFDTRTPLTIGLTCLILGLLCGTLWLWLLDKISWWPRNPGPITKLSRQLRMLGVAQQATFNIDNIRSIHSALASSAGQSLYPNSLEKLFDKAPYLAPDKAEITQFFLQTWALFFENKRQLTIDSIAVAETLKWIKRAAVAERLFRATQLNVSSTKSARLIANHSVNGAIKA